MLHKIKIYIYKKKRIIIVRYKALFTRRNVTTKATFPLREQFNDVEKAFKGEIVLE